MNECVHATYTLVVHMSRVSQPHVNGIFSSLPRLYFLSKKGCACIKSAPSFDEQIAASKTTSVASVGDDERTYVRTCRPRVISAFLVCRRAKNKQRTHCSLFSSPARCIIYFALPYIIRGTKLTRERLRRQKLVFLIYSTISDLKKTKSHTTSLNYCFCARLCI